MSALRRATTADVAAASDAGVGTVSRVLDSAPSVREATRLSALIVIDRLGYRPSHLAASLPPDTAGTTAIVVPHLTRPSAVMRLAGSAPSSVTWSAALPRRLGANAARPLPATEGETLYRVWPAGAVGAG